MHQEMNKERNMQTNKQREEKQINETTNQTNKTKRAATARKNNILFVSPLSNE